MTMASKKKSTTQPQLIEALVGSGYDLDGFTRKGDNLVVRLTPANLSTEKGQFIAERVCLEHNLQASCRVFPAMPQDLLILTVLLPEDGERKTEYGERKTASAEPKPPNHKLQTTDPE